LDTEDTIQTHHSKLKTMANLTSAEEKSIRVQLELQSDIISNYGSINYHIKENATNLLNIISKNKYNEVDKTRTISDEDYQKIVNILYIIKDESKWKKLGVLAEDCLESMRTKIEILAKLK